MKMILAIAFVLCLSLSACASRQPVPGMENITSVTDPKDCKFVRNMYCESRASQMIYYVQLNAAHAGGDSYKIISVNTEMVMGLPVQMINFEVYKCRENELAR